MQCVPVFESRFAAILAMVFCLCCCLQGCVVPRSGPLLREVSAASDRNDIELVSVTPAIAAATHEPEYASYPDTFLTAMPVDPEKLAAGDGVDVTLWGQDSVGLFPPAPGGMTDLGELVLDEAETVRVPYVGSVSAGGLTTAGLRDAVMRRLSRITVGVDVNVKRTDRRGPTVTAQGDLAKPGVYPIAPGTLRLSGLLGLAMPDQTNPEQLEITLRRHGTDASVRLSDIYRDARQDLALRSGDSIVVHHVVENLNVLGAAGGQSHVKLSKRNYSVLDALGDSRGLSDSLADPTAVFLLRTGRPAMNGGIDERPVVYQFDFTRPDQIALAQQFTVRDGDVIYISDAPFTQVQKVLSAFSVTLGTARSVSGMSQ